MCVVTGEVHFINIPRRNIWRGSTGANLEPDVDYAARMVVECEVLNLMRSISLDCHRRIGGPQVPAPRQTIKVIPFTS